MNKLNALCLLPFIVMVANIGHSYSYSFQDLYVDSTIYSILLIQDDDQYIVQDDDQYVVSELFPLYQNLHVEFLYLKIKYGYKNVELEWLTRNETNNSHFDIERSVDGIHFEKIGSIKGHGNINTEVSYIFKDRNPLYNVSYYRLKQVDFDGQFEYSEIVSIVFWSKENVIFPNYSNGLFYINRTGRFQIYNSLGRFIVEIALQEPSDIDLSNLSKGIYYVRFEDHTERIMKL